MKKWMLAVIALTVVFAFSVAPAAVDAKPRGGSYVSPKKSFSPTAPSTPAKSSNVSKSDPAKATANPGATASTANRGFFSGGSLMKGLLIGGLAGMLFGGLFGSMGMLGDLLGLAVNALAIYFLIVIVRSVYQHFKAKRKQNRYPQ